MCKNDGPNPLEVAQQSVFYVITSGVHFGYVGTCLSQVRVDLDLQALGFKPVLQRCMLKRGLYRDLIGSLFFWATTWYMRIFSHGSC